MPHNYKYTDQEQLLQEVAKMVQEMLDGDVHRLEGAVEISLDVVNTTQRWDEYHTYEHDGTKRVKIELDVVYS